MSAAVEIQLGALGFTNQADALRDARGPIEQMRVIREALACIEGYQLACRRHSRALRHTAADFERETLAFCEGSLKARLAELFGRGRLELVATARETTGRP